MLERIPKRATTVLVNSEGRPWKVGAFATGFVRVKRKARLDDLHFHDLRGTAATKFYLANLSNREIAEILGWQEEKIDRIIRRYVGRTAALQRLPFSD
jgi:integrase